jgi:tetratricopeptide (TPR) repeat protein
LYVSLQLLALVDEVAVDTVTRGALKDDSTFKGLRDVIKKGNRVLEDMLVRRERKHTLFIRLVQAHDRDQIERIILWNQKVEKVVGAVTDDREGYSASDTESGNDSSSASSASSKSSVSSRAGVFSRGRQLLPAAGRVRSRRATPTPRLRKHRKDGSDSSDSDGGAADDGFSAVTPHSDLSSLQDGDLPNGLAHRGNGGSQLDHLKLLQPKDELVDVIRGLRVEKMKNREANVDDELAALKPNWRPKADIPMSVPKLPTEYVHRHRLMRQVVGCLLDENELQQAEDGTVQNSIITCVTSRHGDKAGNGKSTLAVAVIQTVEVRERFSDGIAWLKIGRGPLSERDIRRLYEDLYRQLIVKESDIDESLSEDPTDRFQESFASIRTDTSEARIDKVVDRADSVRRFQGGDLDGIKEDLSRMMVQRKVLLCLDDVWRLDDAKWFIFETPTFSPRPRESPYKILITTLVPSLLGNGSCQEVFVRILSEHEAVKLLLSTAGRRPYGGRNSDVFNQSRLIVKGCGNSPLGILLVGSMLRQSNRNWNLNSPAWTGIFNQCSLNLEEAAQLRSFKKAFMRIVDMCFFTVDDPFLRIALRRCFVLYAMAFGSNDWVLSGTGVPESVLRKFFVTVLAAGPSDGEEKIDPDLILTMLENLKLLQRARNIISPATAKAGNDDLSESFNGIDDDNAEKSESDWDELDEAPKRRVQHSFMMHDSLKVVAEMMATRDLPAFTPIEDQFTHFVDHIKEEDSTVICNANSWSAPLRFLFQHLAPQKESETISTLTVEKVNELVAISLIGGADSAALKKKKTISEALKANQLPTELLRAGDKFEEYLMSFLPEHLMATKAFSSVAELLTDPEFIRRRVFALGIMEATGRQVADIIDLRTFVVKTGKKRSSSPSRSPPSSPKRGDEDSEITPVISFDMDTVVCDASRSIIDEVYKTTNNMGSSDSLGMATCLATIGETLLKCRQPRDAMLRLEEAVSIYRGLLGPYHVFTAHALHSVAKALVKLGETRVALLKFAEAARIYEECDATLHYDSIANAQALSSLLVDIGDIRKAESMFEEVISMKRAVYGDNSIPVGKTINSYAILLAKHGRMNDALRNYEIARKTYRNAPATLVMDPEVEIKRDYDVTLITLNIASIYSKKGDLKRALDYYEEGVQGLNEYDAAMDNMREASGVVDNSHKASSHKHLVAALGRIGSLKLKLGDDDNALEAYLQLVDEVEGDSPLASHSEKAKAHIKCATVFRQRDGEENREKSVAHLRDAKRMYEALYGPEHKDTVAINTSLQQWLTEDKAL